jgi:putative hydrolase of the HAD superfamily
MPKITAIAFDADDTLWHNERYFRDTQERFETLLADHAARDHLGERLLAAERRNLGHYGFGIKGFVLSMIETAIEVTEDRVPASAIREIIAMGQDMLAHPVELLPHAREAVEALAGRFRLIVITKGDLLHQEQKIARSGLGDLFDGLEIVSEKTPATYASAFARHGTGAEEGLMVGNSMRSDILPALAAGAWGAHVPHDLVWAVEHAEPPPDAPRFREIADLGALPPLVEALLD